jgi:uncharacterized protein (TIGR02680 family)
VRRVLRGIGLGAGSGPVWVDVDGSFGLGGARGAWDKPEAQYVGATAREAHRLALVVQAESELAALAEDAARINDQLADLETLVEQVRHQRDAVPTAAANLVIEQALLERGARAELVRAEERRDELAAIAEDSEQIARRASDQAQRTGADLAVTPTAEGIAAALGALNKYELALQRARDAAVQAASAHAASDRARSQAGRSRDEADQKAERRRAAEDGRLRAEERFAALQSTVGAAVEELERRLAEVRDRQADLSRERNRLSQEREAGVDARGRAAGSLELLKGQRQEAESRRAESVEALSRFAQTGLLRVALPDLDGAGRSTREDGAMSVRSALALARPIEEALSEVDASDAAFVEVRQRNATALVELRSALGVYGHGVDSIEHEIGSEVRIRYHDQFIGADQLVAEVQESIELANQTLTAKEREILENYLKADISRSLAELMTSADASVEALNRELRDRATSTGVKLRLRWSPVAEGPAGLAELRPVLLRSNATWSEPERREIGSFLQRLIARERDFDPEAGWDAHLERAFDYRAWHTFSVERWQEGRWAPGAGPASTGERALGLALPLFAAAASYYATAGNRFAPRLILLDEAFAGVDDDSRAKAMGLFSAFDLDAAMTSEREWGCYPEVPGLAIANLTRQEGVGAVYVSRWRWDGAQRLAESDPPESARAWQRGGGLTPGGLE